MACVYTITSKSSSGHTYIKDTPNITSNYKASQKQLNTLALATLANLVTDVADHHKSKHVCGKLNSC